uniref:Uncharacterized protein LOC111099686 isoform X1 n=1 Tax=Crassostrea virginica TaxID=6565 RepID=A0A8B8A5Q1_CRAVI|nr:uncharacterized protein LOC111099686 isoform X1 [Crassostrea virginica]
MKYCPGSDMIEMEQILDMMKSDAAQDILALGYYPRSIRKAMERIFLGNKISPENIKAETILQEFERWKEEDNLSDDDLKIKNRDNILNEGMPKGIDKLRQEILVMRRNIYCGCGGQVAYANRGCHHLMCSTCATSSICNKCGFDITGLYPAGFVWGTMFVFPSGTTLSKENKNTKDK